MEYFECGGQRFEIASVSFKIWSTPKYSSLKNILTGATQGQIQKITQLDCQSLSPFHRHWTPTVAAYVKIFGLNNQFHPKIEREEVLIFQYFKEADEEQ